MKNSIFHEYAIPSKQEAPVSYLFKVPLSEYAILDLQNILLSPGLHTITVASIKEGRMLLGLFFPHLKRVIADVGFVTYTKLQGSLVYTDIVEQLSETDFSIDALEFFLLQDFTCDLLWIELDDKMYSQAWLFDFKQRLIDFRIHFTIPIIDVTYLP